MGVELHNQTNKSQNPSQTQQKPPRVPGSLKCWNLGPTHPPISVPKHPPV